MKVKRLKLAITASALMLAIPLIAADRPATNKGKTMTTTTARRTAAWKPETLSGTIMTVDPDQNLVVVRTSDGVPFDMTFTPERRGDVAKSIRING